MRKVEATLGIPNQLTDIDLAQMVPDPVVGRLRALPVEAVVRGYLIGSGWKDYQVSGAVCGIDLPDGLEQEGPRPEDPRGHRRAYNRALPRSPAAAHRRPRVNPRHLTRRGSRFVTDTEADLEKILTACAQIHGLDQLQSWLTRPCK